jgi:hypothetical protein
LPHNSTRSAARCCAEELAPEVVERELRALELAIRARLWVVVMHGGDVA